MLKQNQMLHTKDYKQIVHTHALAHEHYQNKKINGTKYTRQRNDLPLLVTCC